MRLAVGVVLFNPSIQNLRNINNYAGNVEMVYIYDNSEYSSLEKIEQILEEKDYVYFFNKSNDGISKSFNTIFDEAEKDNAEMVILLDQDTIVPLNFIENVQRGIQDNPNNDFYCANVCFEKEFMVTENTDIDFCITSGSIISITYFKQLDGYDENYFIDGIDRDFCFKVRISNGKILCLKEAMIYQVLGDGKKNPFGIYEHSGIRNYYIYRNRLYFLNKYKEHLNIISIIRWKYLSILKQRLSILFFEKNKLEKFHFLRNAKKDFKIGNMGKISVNVDKKSCEG